MDIKKIFKQYGSEFKSIYDEALKELESAKESEIVNLQEYLDNRLKNEEVQEPDIAGNEQRKYDFYKSIGVPDDKIELYMRIYSNFVLVEDVNYLVENDTFIMFDLSKESLEKRVTRKINEAVNSFKEALSKAENITIEEVEQNKEYMEQIYTEAKNIVCSDPMTFVIKYPMGHFKYLKNGYIYYRLFSTYKFINRKTANDVVFLKSMDNRQMRLKRLLNE
jgi:hypothetical protein